jgi:diguanylate cyclase (GGDEF)-like protein
MVARLGGDEFVVVMERIPDAKTAARLAAQALEEIRRPFALADLDTSLSVTASIGVAIFDGGPTQPEQLLAEADAMLYDAKNRGRNAFCVAAWPHPAPEAQAFGIEFA